MPKIRIGSCFEVNSCFVRNSCVIKVFGGVFMLSRCFLDCSVGVGVFVTGLIQSSSFFSFSGVYILVEVSFCSIQHSGIRHENNKT